MTTDEHMTRRRALRTAGMVAAGALAGAATGVLGDLSPAAATDLTASFVSTTSTPAVTATSTTGGAGSAISIHTDGAGITVDGTTIGSRSISALEIDAGAGTSLTAQSSARGLMSNTTSTNALDSALWANATNVATGLSVGSTSGRAVVVRASGIAALHLPSNNPAPPTRVGPSFQAGDVEFDTDGTLWICTADGSPGQWRRLGGTTTAGSFTAIAPTRVYDSRAPQPAPGPLANMATRTISVADGRDASGTVTAPAIVPPGATAVAANLTVVNTVGTNNICANPGGTITHGASTINWFASGQTLANGVTLAISVDRALTLVAGAQGGSADVIVDITGYWR